MKSFRSFLTESVSQLAGVRIERRSTTSVGSHPEARYFNNRIELYDKFFRLRPNEQRHVLCHEVGHWFRDRFVPLSDIMGWTPGEGFYDLFGAGNSEEGFAEAFAVLCLSPGELSRYPDATVKLKAWVKPADVEYVKSWVTKTLASL